MADETTTTGAGLKEPTPAPGAKVQPLQGSAQVVAVTNADAVKADPNVKPDIISASTAAQLTTHLEEHEDLDNQPGDANAIVLASSAGPKSQLRSVNEIGVDKTLVHVKIKYPADWKGVKYLKDGETYPVSKETALIYKELGILAK